MNEKIYPQMWMDVPYELRQQLIKDFNLVRTGGTEVINNEIVTDGYRVTDLERINKESMAEYVGADDEFHRLWIVTIAKAKSIVYPPIGTITGAPKAVQESNNVSEVKIDNVITPTNAKKATSNKK